MVVRFCVDGVEPKSRILIPEIRGKVGKKSLGLTVVVCIHSCEISV